MKKLVTGVYASAWLAAGAADATAQTPDHRFLFDVNVAFQASSQTLQTNSSFPLFGETARVAAIQGIGGAPVLDARIGYFLSKRFAVAAAASGSRNDATSEATATVPSPILFASPSITSLQAQGLERRESVVHVQAVWTLPLTSKMDVAVFGGPSFIRLRQAVTVASLSGQSLSVGSTEETGTTVGFHG